MTVLDSSVAIDYLLGTGAAAAVEEILTREGEATAPEVLVFEVLAVLRRHVGRGDLPAPRAAGAIADLGDLPIALVPTLPLRKRAWDLRQKMTAADGLFVALAEAVEEPLATKDRGLARAAEEHAAITTLLL